MRPSGRAATAASAAARRAFVLGPAEDVQLAAQRLGATPVKHVYVAHGKGTSAEALRLRAVFAALEPRGPSARSNKGKKGACQRRARGARSARCLALALTTRFLRAEPLPELAPLRDRRGSMHGAGELGYALAAQRRANVPEEEVEAAARRAVAAAAALRQAAATPPSF